MRMVTKHLALIPRDGFFAKDGRGWHTSESGRGHGLDWPWPSTVLGALRALWGRGEQARSNTTFSPADWQTRTASIRLGRTLVLRRRHGSTWRVEDATWPTPTDALYLEKEEYVTQIVPQPHATPTLGRDDNAAREALWSAVIDDSRKPLAPPRWWSNEDFLSWLAGGSILATRKRSAPARRAQVHVGIDRDTLVARDGILFSHDVVETIELDGEWALGVEVVLPDGDLPTIATLGARSRLAHVESVPSQLFDPPQRVLEAFRKTSQGLRVVAVTPLCFERGWLPDGLNESHGEFRGRITGLKHDVILRAAFVPRPVYVSGWDMVRRAPKPTSRMVAPGAVYFFERADGQAFSDTDISALWLGALGTRIDEGFGRVVPGVWSPSRSNR